MRYHSLLVTLALDAAMVPALYAIRLTSSIPLLDRLYKPLDEDTNALYKDWKPKVWPDGLVRLDPRRPPRGKRDVLPSSWVIQQIYEGQSFFNAWSFATYPDPTHGQVQYVSKEWAQKSGMVYTNNLGQAIMQVDHWSTLAQGQARNSVRIESYAVYNKGLFILDVDAAPWGCGVWPAWWTCGPNWPKGGEIDILEGVHDNVHNAVTFHTQPGCYLPTPNPKTSVGPNSTGWTQGTDCDAYANSNSGCQTIDTSQASYGTEFNVLKGGVFAMMWANDGIRVWFFHRAAIPADLQGNVPQPNNWGKPVAFLQDNLCSTNQIFYDHQIIFDITFCGDWAGTSYISSGCPGTCSERVMQPGNFANASWTINSLQVYRSPQISGTLAIISRPRPLVFLGIISVLFVMLLS